MPENNRVQNTDKQIVPILKDEPGSITSYDRLLNGRAPVSVELNDVVKGQSDVLNFILPSGSDITPGAGQLDITISGVLESFIFRPGGVAVGNIYTDFVALYNDLSVVDGPTEILFDNSISPTTIPLGTYDFSNTKLSRFVSPENPILGGVSLPVNIATSVVFSGERLFVEGITLRSLSTAPILSVTDSGVIFLKDGAQLEAPGSAAFVSKDDDATPCRIYMDKSRFLSGISPIVEITGSGTGSVDIYLFDRSEIESDTLESGNAADEIRVHIFSPSAILDNTQSGMTGTLTVSLDNFSELVSFDPTQEGLLVATNVQDAIDELSLSVGGGGGFPPEKDEFVPVSIGQTVFTLSESPAIGSTFLLTVNGVEQRESVDYTVAGTTLTWLDNEFTLDTSDILIIHYYS